jgi:PelA/Pel-15E family pectate lyase
MVVVLFLGMSISPHMFGEEESPPPLDRETRQLAEQAESAMLRAVAFFTEKVSTEGGYLWRYSPDLAKREGEGRADDRTVWVQPPGTPTVGKAMLIAYVRTGRPELKKAALAAADCLINGQLVSGGWHYSIYFDPSARKHWAYRVDGTETEGKRNTSTLDDNTTQSALSFLIWMDRYCGEDDPRIHEAVTYGLEALMKAQYPNGGWPQRFDGPTDPEKYPVEEASFPESWSREYPGKSYSRFYTFNDNTISDMIELMLLAYDNYEQERYLDSALAGGDFILRAQLPEPQPGWAQQYNLEMEPAWARKFEPPAITGGESQGILRTLLLLSRSTGKKKYLSPVPRALDYYESLVLPEGRLARFYEIGTDRPLYFTKDYRLTYSDDDMPTHYAFKVSNGFPAIRRVYEQMLQNPPDEEGMTIIFQLDDCGPHSITPPMKARVKRVIDSLEEGGYWLEEEPLRAHDEPAIVETIGTRRFIANMKVLGDFLGAVRFLGDSSPE